MTIIIIIIIITIIIIISSSSSSSIAISSISIIRTRLCPSSSAGRAPRPGARRSPALIVI